ncbi:unnamed protein product [Staurois parvus]|uniref:Uncharacterized protein n=1 Tax=Staurois parvus TaxID=386267 RepID=A0ABN9BLY1_9NEOB|nr:unnamed protein product [Staurois parvus]
MYVKWFDTVMFYYVILVYLVNVTFFVIFKFPAVPSPVHPDARRGRNPDDRCRNPPDYIAGDTAGGTSWERRTR